MTTKTELAVYIRDFLTGGEVYLLDCCMQEPEHEPDGAYAVRRSFEINDRYSDESFPIGISNPEAQKELWSLVYELEKQGR